MNLLRNMIFISVQLNKVVNFYSTMQYKLTNSFDSPNNQIYSITVKCSR